MLNNKKAFLFFIAVLVIAWVAGAILNTDSVKTPRTDIDTTVGNDNNIVKESECVPAGCSRELCVEGDVAKDIFSVCVYKEVYACYKKAICEKQSSGKCGWTETPELIECVRKFE